MGKDRISPKLHENEEKLTGGARLKVYYADPPLCLYNIRKIGSHSLFLLSEITK